MPSQSLLRLLLIGALLTASGCASLTQRDPVQVYVVGIEPLESHGLELRMNVRLRVQNPNDASIGYNGVFLALKVDGNTFASGVSDVSGEVPRFGETVLEVPVSISALRIVRSAMSIAGTEHTGKIAYELEGKLAGPVFSSLRFESKGELTLPKDLYGNASD